MTRPTMDERIAPTCEACGGEMFISEQGDGVLECTRCNAEPVAASDTEQGTALVEATT